MSEGSQSNGEMSEWLKEHAWKATPASCIEWYRNISSRNRFNDFPPQNPSRCEPVNVAICPRFGATLHSFYTILERHFFAYVSDARRHLPMFAPWYLADCSSFVADPATTSSCPHGGIPATVGRFGHSARPSGSREILMGCQKFELSGLTPSPVGKSLGR